MPATRFGEQAGIPYSRCGRTKAPYKGKVIVSGGIRTHDKTGKRVVFVVCKSGSFIGCVDKVRSE